MTRAPADQAVRDRVVRDFDTTFLLEAGASAGKTTVLVSCILALVRTGRATLDRIVAITFTEKAAGELKLRLREGIEDALERTQQADERQRFLAAGTDLCCSRVRRRSWSSRRRWSARACPGPLGPAGRRSLNRTSSEPPTVTNGRPDLG
jgi:ATP-dependent exoDNAse (exonuclease V) beta subunit